MKKTLRTVIGIAAGLLITTASAGPFTTGLEKAPTVKISLSVSK